MTQAQLMQDVIRMIAGYKRYYENSQVADEASDTDFHVSLLPIQANQARRLVDRHHDRLALHIINMGYETIWLSSGEREAGLRIGLPLAPRSKLDQEDGGGLFELGTIPWQQYGFAEGLTYALVVEVRQGDRK